MRLYTAFIMAALMSPLSLGGCAYAQTADKPSEHMPKQVAAPQVLQRSVPDKTKDARPYDSHRDASDDVNNALANARINGTKALIVMGANWCHDSRALAGRFEEKPFKTLITKHYELVYVDVGVKPGQNNQNAHIAARFDLAPIEGTPTVIITDEKGVVLNRNSAGYWRHAHEIPFDMSYAYFAYYAANQRGEPAEGLALEQ